MILGGAPAGNTPADKWRYFQVDPHHFLILAILRSIYDNIVSPDNNATK